jgi:hypothetical protein
VGWQYLVLMNSGEEGADQGWRCQSGIHQDPVSYEAPCFSPILNKLVLPWSVLVIRHTVLYQTAVSFYLTMKVRNYGGGEVDYICKVWINMSY